MEISGQGASFKDRRTGLRVFGALAIAIGALSACLAAFTPIALMVSQASGEVAGSDARGLVFGLVFYASLAVVFVWTGIDSIRVRRWVRPVMVILAWTWLLCGVLALGVWLVMLPDLPAALQAARPQDPPLSTEAYTALSLIASAFLLFAYIGLPAAFVWFYQDRHVKATLEHWDPRVSWTDRCPLPVLGLSLGLGLGALSAIAGLVYGVVPLFGAILTGVPAAAATLVIAGALAWLARSTYRLEMAGWWGTLVLTILMFVSGLVTMVSVDLFEVYRRMGIPAEQIDMMRQSRIMTGPVLPIVAALGAVATLAYLVYILKFFRSR